MRKNAHGLKFGYTIGSCAAGAAKAAAYTLLCGRKQKEVTISTPAGEQIKLDIADTKKEDGKVICAVKKYAGDDPDITDGILIFADVSFREDGLFSIDGGKGVGRITKPGLWQSVGDAAINKVPRSMIEQEVREVFEKHGEKRGADIIISIPQGEELAKKTFNPRLGIEGGLSVLGTTGFVEPMSERALLESLRLELRQKRALGRECLLVSPGNYGADFFRGLLSIENDEIVKCGNFIGDIAEFAFAEGFSRFILCCHTGKGIKLAGNIMNTHSRVADARAEIMAACALRAGCDASLAREILDCTTTDEMLFLLDSENFMQPTMQKAGELALKNLSRRAGEGIRIGLILFSNKKGLLFISEEAEKWLAKEKRKLKEEEIL
ncbi:MAG: cobalamin biosynthesis protein CbiD [Firmicutes bacterium]|nr:cobalamin biosynthesis protein CbiD [Bacillota bacterium]